MRSGGVGSSATRIEREGVGSRCRRDGTVRVPEQRLAAYLALLP